MENQQTKIWESVNQTLSKIEANEYKNYILGLTFYKYLSDQEIQFVKKQGMSEVELTQLNEVDTETSDYIRKELGYFIAYDNLFSTWLEKGIDFDVSDVRDSLLAFDRLVDPKHKKRFGGIFNTLQTDLSKLGESTTKQTRAISDLLQLVNNIHTDDEK